MLLFSRFKISGHSMQPSLNPGDSVIVSSIPYLFRKPEKGDLVLVWKNKKYLVKRIEKVSREKFFLKGDNIKDDLKIGLIEKRQILGKVILKLF